MLTIPAVCPPDSIVIESLTISCDAMPHHYIARAVVLDLEPPAIVSALGATLDRIRQQHPHASQTGWTACNDGLRIYFYHWTSAVWPMAGGHDAA